MNRSKQHKLSENFIHHIVKLAGGFLSTAQLDEFFAACLIQGEQFYVNELTEANVLRIIHAQFDKSSFLLDCVKYPHHVEAVLAIASNSNYLTDIVVRNPQYLFQLYEPSYLQQKVHDEKIGLELSEGINKYNTFGAKLNFLKNHKRRNILKIGIRDILKFNDLSETTEDISSLARNICSVLFSLCYNTTLTKYNITKTTRKYALASLGKLGGNELNYSSDIDLILFYDENKKVGTKKNEYHELIIEAAQLFIKSCSDVTSNGYLYRVDFRLRPDGQYSPLAQTVSDYIRYYELRGENWERQMLLKLDFVCGDINLYTTFKQAITPFIYPQSFFTSPLEQIRKMKNEIEAKNSVDENVKLFPGGIRDIEFSVQALQLINGGRNKNLQTGNSLKAITILFENNLITKSESKTLNEAYVFYRKIEHYFQLMNDVQTHSLPTDKDRLEQIAKYMGYADTDIFQQTLDNYRKKVRKIYNSITKTGNDLNDTSSLLGEIKFAAIDRATKNFRFLKSGAGPFDQKKFDRKSSDLFAKLEAELVEYLSQSTNPDLILENFTKVIRNISLPSVWYNEFLNDKFFSDFLMICQYSQRAIDLISTNKMRAELFITKRIFASDLSTLYKTYTVEQIFLVLAVQYVLKMIGHEQFGEFLSLNILGIMKQEIEDINLDYNFFVAGLGSFAAGEMTFGSDVDLIFVAESISNDSTIQNDFQKLFLKLQQAIKPVKLDARLRPEGKSSQLVWDIGSYKNYLRNRARVWEFQSLLKLKFIAGDNRLFDSFVKGIVDSIEQIKKQYIDSEIIRMLNQVQKEKSISFSNKTDIKTAPGGLLHITSFLDSLILKNATTYEATIGKSIEERFKYLSKIKFNFDKMEILRDNYKFLKSIELTTQNLLNTNFSVAPNDDLTKKLLSELLLTKSIDDLSTELNKRLQTNISIITKHWSKTN